MNLDDICSFVNSEFRGFAAVPHPRNVNHAQTCPKDERMMKDDPSTVIGICRSFGLQYNGCAETVIALGQSPPAHGLAVVLIFGASFASVGAKEN